MSVGTVYFGGPDRPVGALRDLLLERVEAVPSGGSIEWVTYYFRDRRLAAALIAAHERGVDLRVTVEGYPRSIHANDSVIEMLRGPLGKRLRVARLRTDGKRRLKLLRSRLHAKLYCFSHPEPVALVGSFNPSGDEPEEHPELIQEIGDHDRGHNALVEFSAPDLVSALVAHARGLHDSKLGPFGRLMPSANRAHRYGGVTLHFWPRASGHPIKRFLSGLPAGSRIRLAQSHLSGESTQEMLLGLAGRGIEIEVFTDQTDRRASPALEEKLRKAGIALDRVAYDEWIPMHNKFALVEAGADRSVLFGSYNWSKRSQYYNHEIGVVACDPDLYSAFADRWEVLAEQVRRHERASRRG